jgi:hypothetical protein
MADEAGAPLEGYKGLEMIAASALEGAKAGLARAVEFEHGEPIIVVNVAWRDGEGNPLIVGSGIPTNHGHEFLAESLRTSAKEAEEEI